MDTALQGSGYSECWRGFNSHWHDDRRRHGDVVVWCLFPGRKIKTNHEDGMVGLITKGKRLLGSEQREQGGRAENSAVMVPKDAEQGSRSGGFLTRAKGSWGVGKTGDRPEAEGEEKDKASTSTWLTGWWNAAWRRVRGEQSTARKRKGAWS